MADDRHVDGNALAGILYDLFGREMTNELGCCGHCGETTELGAVRVYRTAGDVFRCPTCGNVLIVIVQHAAGLRVGFESIRWLQTNV